MTTRINYVGDSDVRIWTRADVIAHGLTDPGTDLIWDKTNSFERDVADDIAIFLVGQGDFTADEFMNFGEVLGDFLEGPPGPAGVGAPIVEHGSDADFARPASADPVIWEGSVYPNNIEVGDWFLDTAELPDLMAAPTLVIPPMSNFLNNATTAWFIAHGCIFHRFDLPVGGNYRYILCKIGTSSGNIQVGVVKLSGSSLLDYERVAHSGIIASPGTGQRRIDLGEFHLDAGPHALFFYCDNTTLTIGQAVIANGDQFRAAQAQNLDAAGVPASGTLTAWTSNRLLTGLSMEANV